MQAVFTKIAKKGASGADTFPIEKGAVPSHSPSRTDRFGSAFGKKFIDRVNEVSIHYDPELTKPRI